MDQICDKRHGLQQNDSAPREGMLLIVGDGERNASGATRGGEGGKADPAMRC